MLAQSPSSRIAAQLDSHGLVFARLFDADGTSTALKHMPAELPNASEAWIWIHLDLVDRRALRWLQNVGLPTRAAQSFSSEDTRPRLDKAENVVFGVFAEMTADPSHHGKREKLLRFALCERWIITGRYFPLEDLDKLRQKLELGLPLLHPSAVLEWMNEASIDRLHGEVDRMLISITRIEDMVIERGGTDAGGEIASLRRKAVTVHRELSLGKPMVRRLTELVGELNLPPAQCKEAEAQLQKMEALHGEVHTLQDRARLLKDEVASNIASDMNRSLYIISMISALLLPPSLIFGLFGINVGGLPLINNELGFVSVVALGLLSSALVFMLLRKRD